MSLAPDPARAVVDRRGPWLLVAASVLFAFVALQRDFLVAVPEVNDRVLHRALVTHVAEHWSEHWPVDPWYPSIAGGFPVFAHYPHLSHLISAGLSRAAPFEIDAATIYLGLAYCLLVLLPVVIYVSMRKLGLEPWCAALGAALYPLVRAVPFFGIGWESYLNDGSGLLAQLWGVALIFPALAWGYDAIRTGRCWAAGLLLAGTALSHSLYGYMAALSLGLLLFLPVGGVRGSRRIARLATVGAIALAASAYFVVPVVLYGSEVLRSQWEPAWKWDSIGFREVALNLADGRVFDGGGWPVLSILVAIGLAVCTARAVGRRDVRCAWLVMGFVLWVLLFVGRAGWGSLVDLLPLSSGLHMHRFIAGIQLFGLILAAVGIHGVLASLFARRRFSGMAGALAVALLLTVPLAARLNDLRANARVADARRTALSSVPELGEMVDYLRALPPGRVHAGMYYDWGRQLTIGDIPLYTHLQAAGFDMVGYLFMAMAIPGEWQVRLDYARLRSHELYNARYLVAPAAMAVPSFAEPRRRFGPYAVYEIATGGYFALGTVVAPTAPSKPREWADTFAAGMEWITGPGPGQRRYLLMDGAVEPAVAAPVEGQIEDEQVGPGRFACKVRLSRATDVVIKATAHPFWRATLDGADVPIVRVFPGFMAVRAPPGDHRLELSYQPPGWKRALFVLALAFVVLGSVVSVGWGRPGRGGGPATLTGS